MTEYTISTKIFREKFEVQADDAGKVHFSTTIGGDQHSTTQYHWLAPEYARQIATALLSAADEADQNKKKEVK